MNSALSSDPAAVAATLNSMRRDALRHDEEDARAAASLLLSAASRAQRHQEDWEQSYGQSLAAAPNGQFPLVWVAPALGLGEAFGPEVSAWVMGYEERTFLRLVNVPADGPRGLPALRLESGRVVQPEFRVRPELPFALDELAEDCVFELLPCLEGECEISVAGASWVLPTVGYSARTERPGLRESWAELMTAYAQSNATNPAARRAQLSGALDRLLFVGGDRSGEPRCLRPWALLTLQALSAEILRAVPRRAREYGLAALGDHPQCFASLGRRLPRENNAG